jgi:hypothetical protein
MSNSEPDDSTRGVSRRNFIKDVIATGAVASSTSYLFRANGILLGQNTRAGSVERLTTRNVNGQLRRVDILREMGHEARLVPIGARPPLGDRIRHWNGASCGHWQGDTL